MSKFKIIAYISDIHIGNRVVRAKDMKQMLKDNYFEPIMKMKHLDAVLVLGDVAHSLLNMNSEYGELYLWFFRKLYKCAKKRGFVVGIVQGTKSHDLDQLEVIQHMQYNDEGVSFNIYKEYQSVYLFEDYKMLVLPDIKVNSSNKEHVNYLLEDKYDLVIGHGTIDRLDFQVQDSESLDFNSYIFPVKKLMEISRGPVVFGHIHAYTEINKKFYYSGSFTKVERIKSTHGFLIGAISDKDHTKFKIEQYINKDSIEFHDITITEAELESLNISEILDTIKEMIKEAHPYDLFTIRLKLTGSTYVNDKVHMIDDSFGNNKQVSIVKSIVSKKEEEMLRNFHNKKDKLAYLFDLKIPVPNIYKRYYDEEARPTNPKYKNVDISLEDIERLLSINY